MWRRRLYPNNLALVTSSGVLIPLGSSLMVVPKKRKWSVYPLTWALVSRLVVVRVVRARTSFFSGISACAFDGETKFLVAGFHSCLNTLGVASPDATVLAVRGAELRSGVGLCLTVSSCSGVGLATFEISGCGKKTLSRECGMSCFVYAMERETERTTTGFSGGGAVDG